MFGGGSAGPSKSSSTSKATSKPAAKPKAPAKPKASAKPKTKPQVKPKATKKSKARGDDDEDDDDKDASEGSDSDDEDDDEDANAEDEDEDEEDDSPDPKAKKAKGGGRVDKNLDLSLPPISNIQHIFTDIVKRFPDLKEVADHLQGRPLRVATMCSGTESPLLALEMICECLKTEYDADLRVEHVFSCEIEPFKQAYIERNFQPPLLFRDVCELGDGEA